MIRIDSHQHFWEYDAEEFAWIDDEMRTIRRSFSPPDLEPYLAVENIRGSVAVQARQTEEENEYLLGLHDGHESVLGVVGWVDLQSETCRDDLEFWSHRRGFVGVRHIVQGEPDPGFMARPAFRTGIAALAEFDLAYDILIYSQQIPQAIELAKALPNQRFVLDHLAKPPLKVDELNEWRAGIGELAKYENVWAKVSGLAFEADWGHWNTDTLQPVVDHALSCFGPDRLMLGSDWPVCLPAGSFARIWDSLEECFIALSDDEKAKVFGQNAFDFYKLKIESGDNPPD